METHREKKSAAIKVITWSARVLGVPALGSFFVMLFLGRPGGFSHEGVLNPFLLAFWLPILLYLVSWGLDSRKRARAKADI